MLLAMMLAVATQATPPADVQVPKIPSYLCASMATDTAHIAVSRLQGVDLRSMLISSANAIETNNQNDPAAAREAFQWAVAKIRFVYQSSGLSPEGVFHVVFRSCNESGTIPDPIN